MVETTKSLADIYYEELQSTPNPGSTLMKFFCELYKHNRNREDIVLFNELVETYGKERVFNTILDVGSRVRNEKKSPNYMRILIKRNLSSEFSTMKKLESRSDSDDLTDLVASREKSIRESTERTLRIPKVFEDE